MANTLENTLNKIDDAANALVGNSRSTVNGFGGKQTCLERISMEARREHLYRNEWRKDLEYSKPLVDAEYEIQTEFKVTSFQDRLNNDIKR